MTLGSRHIQLAAAFVAIMVATVTGIWSAGANVHEIDIDISRRVQQWQGSVPSFMQRLADACGDTPGAILGFAILGVIAWRWNGPTDVRFVVITAGFRIVGMLLKGIFNSPRPTDDFVQLLGVYENTGYPSGHSMTAAMLSGTLVVLVWRRSSHAAIRWSVLVLALVFTLIVGWSRIWAGAHWPTDVLGGWMYGTGFVLLAAWIAFARRGNSSP